MTAISLTPAERKDKRGLAHHLDPVVIIGSEGLTPAVLKEAEAALKAHGLIKVRMHSDVRADRETALMTLADTLGAAPVQHIGKLFVLWRPVAEKTVAAERPVREGGRGLRLLTLVKPSKSPTHRPTVKKIRLPGNERVTAGGIVKRAKPRATSIKKRQAG